MQAFGAVLVLKPARHPANASRRRRQLQLWLHSPPAQLLVQRPAPHRLCRQCGAPLSCRMSSEQLQGQLPSCLCAGETRVSGPANATIINVQVMYGKRTHDSTHSSPSTAKTVTQRALGRNLCRDRLLFLEERLLVSATVRHPDLQGHQSRVTMLLVSCCGRLEVSLTQLSHPVSSDSCSPGPGARAGEPSHQCSGQ